MKVPKQRIRVGIALVVLSLIQGGSGVAQPASQKKPVPACYHYRVAVVVIPREMQPDKPTAPILSVIDIWRQGNMLRVQDEHGNKYFESSGSSVLVTAKGEAWMTKVRDKFKLTLIHGFPFAFAASVVEGGEIFQLTVKPVAVQTVDGIPCAYYNLSLSEAAAKLGLESEQFSTLIFRYWVPLRPLDVPARFLRMSMHTDVFTIEVRVVHREQVAPKPSAFFRVAKEVHPRELDETELTLLFYEGMRSWFAQFSNSEEGSGGTSVNRFER